MGPERGPPVQIEHLIALSTHPTVQLRIQRFEDGPPTGTHSMINILGFRDDEPILVFLETDYSVEEVSKPESVQGYSNRSSVPVMPRLNPRTPRATSNVLRNEWSSHDRPVSGDLAESPPQRA